VKIDNSSLCRENLFIEHITGYAAM